MKEQELIDKIQALKKDKKVLIVAHYYAPHSVQSIADAVGDSYYLSKVCKAQPEQTIIFCGVKFMGESAKILSPEKKIIMVDSQADCPMAHMITEDKIVEMRQKYEDLAVVCYINSTAEIKAHSDVVVTSSNAYRVISRLPQKYIFFIPDQHLGHFVAKQLPNKQFIFNEGYCPIHTKIKVEELKKLKQQYPKAQVVAHPECTEEIVEIADYVGSTAGILEFVKGDTASTIIVATEAGILYQLKKNNPNKQFLMAHDQMICPDMKLNTLQKVYHALLAGDDIIEVEDKIAQKAKEALLKMHELGD